MFTRAGRTEGPAGLGLRQNAVRLRATSAVSTGGAVRWMSRCCASPTSPDPIFRATSGADGCAYPANWSGLGPEGYPLGVSGCGARCDRAWGHDTPCTGARHAVLGRWRQCRQRNTGQRQGNTRRLGISAGQRLRGLGTGLSWFWPQYVGESGLTALILLGRVGGGSH